MPTISKIRLTNVIYEEGNKRYNDELFLFDGHNGAILIENGGGKTVFIQTALQAILPHTDLADRKIKNTLMLENAPAHIAIEWITNERPRRYVVTAVSLYTVKNGLDSLRYVYEYNENDPNGIEGIPFVRETREGKRAAERGEMQDYYAGMREKTLSAQTFKTIKEYKTFLEEQYTIISSEWESIVKINSSEGGVEAFFDECKNTNQLFDRLLIPTVEDSIVGHDSHLFADLFEQQLASLKNYKKLKETIEENKQISGELEKYSETYETLHEYQMDYEKAKQRAKGVWNEIILEHRKQIAAQEANSTSLQEWKADSSAHALKSDSYTIFVEQSVLSARESKYKKALAAQTGIQEALQQNRHELHALKWAKAKQERTEQEDALRLFEQQLAQFDQKDDAGNLRDQLETARRELLGCYERDLAELAKIEQELGGQLQPILKQIEADEQTKKNASGKEKGLLARLSETKGAVKTRLEQLEKLKRELLSNPEQETVKEQLVKWQERDQLLDETIIKFNQQEKEALIYKKEAEERKAAVQTDRIETNRAMDRLRAELAAMEKAQRAVIEQLSALRRQWSALETVYLEPDSIEQRMLEKMNQITADREALFHKERIARRFVDDHADQSVFFGDTFMEKQLFSWKNQVDYLVSGVDYLQSMSEEERKNRLRYPLWPLTLVTTNTDKPRVVDKLNHVADRLQYPITVLTTEEALEVHERSAVRSWVAPSHWQGNTDAVTFAEWKKQIGIEAEKVTADRVAKEQELAEWKDALRAFRQFLMDYPYESTDEKKTKLGELTNKNEQLALELRREEQMLNDLDAQISNGREKTDQYREERHGLARYIEKGHEYLRVEKMVAEGRSLEQQLKEKLQLVEQELDAVNQKLNRLNAERGTLERRAADIKLQLQLLRQDDDYQSLSELTPAATNESKKVIKDKIDILRLKLREIDTARGEWIAKRDEAVRNIKRLTDEMELLRRSEGTIDESRAFPVDGKQQIQSLQDRIFAQIKEEKTCGDDVRQAETEKNKQEGKLDTLVIQFEKSYPNEERIAFDTYDGNVEEDLAAEIKHLNERKTYIDQEAVRIEQDRKAIESAKYNLEMFEEAHHFKAPDVSPISLTNEEILDFTYNRKKVVAATKHSLKENQGRVAEGASEVSSAQRAFRAFCRANISDVKLRQMAISGIETKQSYEAIIEFKKNMATRIESISHYAHEHIRQSDKDLQLFIDQIHTHLRTLAEELRQIPKKTKVKVQDDWKPIYAFKIPDWNEEEGKTRIRNYIEWILTQLEDERFLDEERRQDSGKVRKELDMWLQSKQLLRIVMDNEVLKVSCRKVANDNTVTTRAYSWEQSNIWSGGEKWSKNMTLFLGILNYVAEKKKHIQSSAKLHRAVILDNPFGQASSDHVLSPVFFVAQQLGFQIIALTALAEGKFLQDYFPVIYSCRLRGSSGSGKQVMTKEKWIRKAFFEDHDPQVLERLGETEQLGLFD
ncbi:hypothetical protein NOM01_09355 [Sporolactobacillus sp. STSJ-5]|uniref:hypothetical protein n=1 Tax=Sporolactobacillus sp. STSJ-5 TaxID=2965076 RepID=UPI002102B6EA|nr:hypothetical protein [Sporolactobacillus sp. STSJ-5]MCQ2010218.1 hypothetical protein [Sporolactobacillus sp. STSJ-5]